MKKLLLTIVFAAGIPFFASAQVERVIENPTERAQEKLQQEPPQQTQTRIETAARRTKIAESQNKKKTEMEILKKNRANAEKAKAKSKQEKIQTIPTDDKKMKAQ